ncbi:Hsp20/alpha crystallin family protein [Plantactinospora sp. WMMB334]|uniref:Hsp20/alpha crystallin family protein n=1 Tax=Plantactinospora sp. WMMB334 TaxID=3404119 RepID=UPI003B9247C2
MTGLDDDMVAVLDRLRAGLLPLERALRGIAGRDITIEEYAEPGRYVVQAELPGVDPGQDVSLSVFDGELKIDVKRVDWHRHGGSEFRYGTFSRTVTLPRRAAEETLSATYERGVLEVSVQVAPLPPISRSLPIRAR